MKRVGDHEEVLRRRTGAHALNLLRPLFCFYGRGSAGTFAWLFVVLSGTSACALAMEQYRGVVGLTSQWASVWPAIWGGRVSGNAAVTPLMPVEVVVAALAFFAILALAQALTSREPKEQGTAAERKSLESARNEPAIKAGALTGSRSATGDSLPDWGQGMVVQHFSRRFLLNSLILSLFVSVVVSFSAVEPTRAKHYVNHPAVTPSNRAFTLFKSGTEIKIRKDAKVYITSRSIPENDRLLEAYNADRSNGGRVQTRFGKATAIPGLLGIANQAHRAGDPNGQNDQAYSLADAMRDAIWRMNTSARLKFLTASQSACADGAAGKTPSIGLIVIC